MNVIWKSYGMSHMEVCGYYFLLCIRLKILSTNYKYKLKLYT